MNDIIAIAILYQHISGVDLFIYIVINRNIEDMSMSVYLRKTRVFKSYRTSPLVILEPTQLFPYFFFVMDLYFLVVPIWSYQKFTTNEDGAIPPGGDGGWVGKLIILNS